MPDFARDLSLMPFSRRFPLAPSGPSRRLAGFQRRIDDHRMSQARLKMVLRFCFSNVTSNSSKKPSRPTRYGASPLAKHLGRLSSNSMSGEIREELSEKAKSRAFQEH